MGDCDGERSRGCGVRGQENCEVQQGVDEASELSEQREEKGRGAMGEHREESDPHGQQQQQQVVPQPLPLQEVLLLALELLQRLRAGDVVQRLAHRAADGVLVAVRRVRDAERALRGPRAAGESARMCGLQPACVVVARRAEGSGAVAEPHRDGAAEAALVDVEALMRLSLLATHQRSLARRALELFSACGLGIIGLNSTCLIDLILIRWLALILILNGSFAQTTDLATDVGRSASSTSIKGILGHWGRRR